MKKAVALFIMLILGGTVGCNFAQKTEIGLITENKENQTVVQEVVLAFYQEVKNFVWADLDTEVGLKYWTKTGYEVYWLEKGYDWFEFIKENRLSGQLKGVEFTEIEVGDEQAWVKVVSDEIFTSEITEELQGLFKGYATLELRKNEQIWQIISYDFHFTEVKEK